jgi:hypothetical protein
MIYVSGVNSSDYYTRYTWYDSVFESPVIQCECKRQ